LARLDSPRAIEALSKILIDGTIAEKQFALTTLGTIPSRPGKQVRWKNTDMALDH
jgi:hypothetical protein